jgi:uncharacterized protein YgiM (DUF1202 family)
MSTLYHIRAKKQPQIYARAMYYQLRYPIVPRTHGYSYRAIILAKLKHAYGIKPINYRLIQKLQKELYQYDSKIRKKQVINKKKKYGMFSWSII